MQRETDITKGINRQVAEIETQRKTQEQKGKCKFETKKHGKYTKQTQI